MFLVDFLKYGYARYSQLKGLRPIAMMMEHLEDYIKKSQFIDANVRNDIDPPSLPLSKEELWWVYSLN